MKGLSIPIICLILLSLDKYSSMSIPEMTFEDDIGTEEVSMDPGEMIRHSALVSGVEMVNASDVQEFRERTNANVSHTLSNTSLADLESDNLTQLLQIKYRERKRQERLLVIQAQILQRLRMSRQPNISANVFSEDEQRRINIIFQRMHDINNNNNPANEHHNHHNNHHGNHNNHFGDGGATAARIHRLHTTMQRLQSFYPSCSLPNNTDKATWESPGSFRIFYQLPRSRYFLGTDLTVLLGKLRLYKIATSFGDAWEPNLLELQRYNSLDSLARSEPTGGINVSIYQYLKPLRYNRKEKKRLIQTRTVSLDKEGWIDFNVLASLNFWLHHSHKNFGFDVEVEDAMGNKLNPNLFFRNMNCSAAATASQDPPFPNIMEIHPEMLAENESALFDNETYPTLDLQTADVNTLNAAALHLFPPSSLSANEHRRSLKKRHLHHRANTFQEIDNPTTCTPETIFMTFEELGLDHFILSPNGFQWTFCSGECPTRGATLQEGDLSVKRSGWLNRLREIWKHLLKGKNPYDRTVSDCTSTDKEPLHIVYYDDDHEIQETTLEDLLPTNCACAIS